mgnify:CR=1 FL=1
MARIAQRSARRRPRHRIHPASGAHLAIGISELDGVGERTRVDRCTVDLTCERRVHTTSEIRPSRGEELTVRRVEGTAQHSALEFLPDESAHPPIVGAVENTHADAFGP